MNKNNITSDEDDIENLKKMLMSRDKNLQIKAVNLINKNLDAVYKNGLNYDAVLKYLIINDLCSYLSDASATLDIQLLREIIYSMKHFSKSYLFYKNSCSPFITAAFVRAAHLFMKNDDKENIFQSILFFFIESFSRINHTDLPPIISYESLYDTKQLFFLIQSLCEIENKDIHSFLLGSKVLHVIISIKATDIKITQKTAEDITDSVEKYLEKLNNMLIEKSMTYDKKDNYFNCIFGMMCHICIDMIKFCQFLETRHIVIVNSKACKNNHIDRQLTMIGKNMELISKAMESIVGKIMNYESSMDIFNYEIFLKFLNLFLNETILQEIMPQFVKTLLRKNFLLLLPRIRTKSKDDNVRRLCQLNLAEILVLLSNQELDLSNWNGGSVAFKHHIYEGLLSNEEDVMILLQNHGGSFPLGAALDAVIVYLYFNCINSEENLVKLLLPQIVQYISSLSNKKCALPILKCLWLIFAVANTSEKDVLQNDENKLSISTASYKLANLISFEMEKVYTHNIYIIKWNFSSISIPFYTQYRVLSMWLQREKNIPPYLMSVVAVWWSLIEIIRNGIISSLVNAVDLLKLCIEENCHDPSIMSIKEALWDYLPNTFTVYMENEHKDDDLELICMLDLCSSYYPPKIDNSIMQRISILLVTILPMINKNKENLIQCILNEVFCLLSISLKQENTTILNILLNSKSLLEILHNTMKYSNANLSCMACNILSTLTYYSHVYNFECNVRVSIDSAFFIDLLKTDKDENKCISTLQILYTYFKAMCKSQSERKILVNIPLNFESDVNKKTFFGLYFRLQMICCKDSKMLSEGAWQCLNQMLQYTLTLSDQTMFLNISLQPWTGILIKLLLTQNDLSKISLKFLCFVDNWLNSIKILKEKYDNTSYAKKILDDKYSIFLKPIVCIFHTLSNEEIQKNLEKRRRCVVINILSTIKEL